jgi:hypothetical protein
MTHIWETDWEITVAHIRAAQLRCTMHPVVTELGIDGWGLGGISKWHSCPGSFGVDGVDEIVGVPIHRDPHIHSRSDGSANPDFLEPPRGRGYQVRRPRIPGKAGVSMSLHSKQTSRPRS